MFKRNCIKHTSDGVVRIAARNPENSPDDILTQSPELPLLYAKLIKSIRLILEEYNLILE